LRVQSRLVTVKSPFLASMEHLEIDINFADVPANLWGWNGETF